MPTVVQSIQLKAEDFVSPVLKEIGRQSGVLSFDMQGDFGAITRSLDTLNARLGVTKGALGTGLSQGAASVNTSAASIMKSLDDIGGKAGAAAGQVKGLGTASQTAGEKMAGAAGPAGDLAASLEKANTQASALMGSLGDLAGTTERLDTQMGRLEAHLTSVNGRLDAGAAITTRTGQTQALADATGDLATQQERANREMGAATRIPPAARMTAMPQPTQVAAYAPPMPTSRTTTPGGMPLTQRGGLIPLQQQEAYNQTLQTSGMTTAERQAQYDLQRGRPITEPRGTRALYEAGRTGARAAQNVGIGTAVVGAGSLYEAVKFDKAGVAAAASANLTPNQERLMERTVLSMYKTMPVSYESLFKMYQAAAETFQKPRGATDQQYAKMLQQIVMAGARSGIGTGATQPEIINQALAATLHGFGIAPSQSTNVMDILHSIAAYSGRGTRVETLAQNMAKSSALAPTIGVSLPQWGALYAELSKQFGPTQTDTQLRQLEQNIRAGAGTKGGEAFLQNLGLTRGKSAITGASLGTDLWSTAGIQKYGIFGVIQRLRDRINQYEKEGILTPEDAQHGLAHLVPTQRGGTALAYLLQPGRIEDTRRIGGRIGAEPGPAQSRYGGIGTLQLSKEVSGVTEKFYAQMLKQPGAQLETSFHKINAAAITLGNTLAPAAERLARDFARLAGYIEPLIKQHPTATTRIVEGGILTGLAGFGLNFGLSGIRGIGNLMRGVAWLAKLGSAAPAAGAAGEAGAVAAPGALVGAGALSGAAAAAFASYEMGQYFQHHKPTDLFKGAGATALIAPELLPILAALGIGDKGVRGAGGNAAGSVVTALHDLLFGSKPKAPLGTGYTADYYNRPQAQQGPQGLLPQAKGMIGDAVGPWADDQRTKLESFFASIIPWIGQQFGKLGGVASQALMASGGGISSAWDGIRQSVGAAAAGLVSDIVAAFGHLGNQLNAGAVTNTLSGLAGAYKTTFEGILKATETIFSGVSTAIESKLGQIKGVVGSESGAITSLWSAGWSKLQGLTGPPLDAVLGVVKSVFGQITSFVSGEVGKVGGLLTSGAGDWLGVEQGAWGAIVGAYKRGLDQAHSVVSSAMGDISGLFQSAWGVWKGAFDSGFHQIFGRVGQWKDNVIGLLQGWSNDWNHISGQAMGDMLASIGSGLGNIAKKMQGWIGDRLADLGGFADKAPQHGADFMVNLAKGMAGKAGQIKDAIVGAFQGAIHAAGSWISGHVGQLWSSITDHMPDWAKKALGLSGPQHGSAEPPAHAGPMGHGLQQPPHPPAARHSAHPRPEPARGGHAAQQPASRHTVTIKVVTGPDATGATIPRPLIGHGLTTFSLGGPDAGYSSPAGGEGFVTVTVPRSRAGQPAPAAHPNYGAYGPFPVGPTGRASFAAEPKVYQAYSQFMHSIEQLPPELQGYMSTAAKTFRTRLNAEETLHDRTIATLTGTYTARQQGYLRQYNQNVSRIISTAQESELYGITRRHIATSRTNQLAIVAAQGEEQAHTQRINTLKHERAQAMATARQGDAVQYPWETTGSGKAKTPQQVWKAFQGRIDDANETFNRTMKQRERALGITGNAQQKAFEAWLSHQDFSKGTRLTTAYQTYQRELSGLRLSYYGPSGTGGAIGREDLRHNTVIAKLISDLQAAAKPAAEWQTLQKSISTALGTWTQALEYALLTGASGMKAVAQIVKASIAQARMTLITDRAGLLVQRGLAGSGTYLDLQAQDALVKQQTTNAQQRQQIGINDRLANDPRYTTALANNTRYGARADLQTAQQQVQVNGRLAADQRYVDTLYKTERTQGIINEQNERQRVIIDQLLNSDRGYILALVQTQKLTEQDNLLTSQRNLAVEEQLANDRQHIAVTAQQTKVDAGLTLVKQQEQNAVNQLLQTDTQFLAIQAATTIQQAKGNVIGLQTSAITTLILGQSKDYLDTLVALSKASLASGLAQAGLDLTSTALSGDFNALQTALTSTIGQLTAGWQSAVAAGAGYVNQFTAGLQQAYAEQEQLNDSNNRSNIIIGLLTGTASLLNSGLQGLLSAANDKITFWTAALGRSADGIKTAGGNVLTLATASIKAAQNLGSLDDIISGLTQTLNAIKSAGETEFARTGQISPDTMKAYGASNLALSQASWDKVAGDIVLEKGAKDITGYISSLGDEIDLFKKKLLSDTALYGAGSPQVARDTATLSSLIGEFNDLNAATTYLTSSEEDRAKVEKGYTDAIQQAQDQVNNDLKQGVRTDLTSQNAQNAVDNANLSLQQAQQRLSDLQSSGTATAGQIQIAQDAVSKATNTLNTAQNNLEKAQQGVDPAQLKADQDKLSKAKKDYQDYLDSINRGEKDMETFSTSGVDPATVALQGLTTVINTSATDLSGSLDSTSKGAQSLGQTVDDLATDLTKLGTGVTTLSKTIADAVKSIGSAINGLAGGSGTGTARGEGGTVGQGGGSGVTVSDGISGGRAGSATPTIPGRGIGGLTPTSVITEGGGGVDSRSGRINAGLISGFTTFTGAATGGGSAVAHDPGGTRTFTGGPGVTVSGGISGGGSGNSGYQPVSAPVGSIALEQPYYTGTPGTTPTLMDYLKSGSYPVISKPGSGDFSPLTGPLQQIADNTGQTASNTAAINNMDPAAVAVQLRELLQNLINVAPAQSAIRIGNVRAGVDELINELGTTTTAQAI